MTEDDEIIERIAIVGFHFAYPAGKWDRVSPIHQEQHRAVARKRLAGFRKEGLIVAIKPKRKTRCAAADSTTSSCSPD